MDNKRKLTKQQSLYIDNYLLKSKDKMIEFMDKSKNSEVLDVPGVGWIEYEIYGKCFWVWTAYSKSPHSLTKLVWNKIIKIAKKNNCEKIQFVTSRNPKAFQRLFNVKTIQWKLELNLKEVKNGNI